MNIMKTLLHGNKIHVKRNHFVLQSNSKNVTILKHSAGGYISCLNPYQ